MSKKEIGSKLKKKLLRVIIAPGVSDSKIQELLHFIQINESDEKAYLLNRSKEVLFFKEDQKYVPSIQFLRNNREIDLPVISVDQGAVKHVLNGADIFSQGITTVEKQFAKDAYILVKNPQNAIISVGKSLLNSEQMIGTKGKAIINLHYLGDLIWENTV